MNIYLIILLVVVGVAILGFIVLCFLRAVAICKLVEGKYDEEEW